MDNNLSDAETDWDVFAELDAEDNLTELVSFPHSNPVEESTNGGATPALSSDPEFDAYMAVVKLLIGGTVEGAAELTRRLERWELELSAEDSNSGPGEIHNANDAARFMLVGLALDVSDGVRQRVFGFIQASDAVFRFSGSVARPLVKNRLTGIVGRPFDRAFNRLMERGQKNVDRWIAMGRAEEPDARQLARRAYVETVNEFIGRLAENQELAALVQKKSVGLATEAMDEFRSRTVSADAMAENIVRRILRRPPRPELFGPGEMNDLDSNSE